MKSDPIKQVIVRACTDAEFRARLIKDPAAAVKEEGLEVPAGVKLVIHEGSDDTMLVVLPGQEAVEWVDRRNKLPSGIVKDIPEGLTLVWQGHTLTAVGRIDGKTAQSLKKELQKAFSDIDLEMNHVEFLSSAGLSALLAGQKHLAEHGAAIRLVNVPEEVRNVLDLAGFSEMFEITDMSELELPPSAFYGPTF